MEPLYIKQILPSLIIAEGFELQDANIIPSNELKGEFDPENHTIELHLYDGNKNLLYSDYNIKSWSIIDDPNLANNNKSQTIELNPDKDLINAGFIYGKLFPLYNFISYELGTSFNNRYYISEISSDRTEIRLKSNYIDNFGVESQYNIFKNKLDSADYFDEFYINLFDNKYEIGINVLLDKTQDQYSILIKLYNPLFLDIELKSEVTIISKVAETIAYDILFPDPTFQLDDLTYIKGPNININLKDQINNTTNFKSKQELDNISSFSNYNQLKNILNTKGVALTPNYSYDTFDEFVHFSSAKTRIENFIQKLTLIESYENNLQIINSITGSTSGSSEILSNKTIIENQITNIIQNLDGYEYYLYFDSGSSSFPKQNSTPSYIPYSVTSSEATTWLGTDDEVDPNYGGIILSASFYDNKNQNYLLYTIPEFIRENTDNSQYVVFINMIGHYFDEIWLYTKNITEKLNNTNEIDKGVPLDLISKTIESFGFNLVGNNLNNLDNTIGFLGQESGSFTPSTGSEYITDYVAVNQNNSTNYWNPNIPIFDFPYPTDNISKEIMKRLYHNMVYLLKKKGTVSGLRQLINCWGIPNTILRINEFGGKNKDNTNDYDYWYERYSYAFKTNASSSVRIPWMPLERNRIVDNKHIVPDVIEFRFKTPVLLPTSSITQPLLFKKSNSTLDSTSDFLLTLNYESLTTSSYSGSNDLQYNKYGTLTFQMNGSQTASLYLPFYNGDWWSVMIRRNAHIDSGSNGENISYNLIAQNKIYVGSDGNETGYFDSTELNAFWYPPEYGSGTYESSVYGGYGDGATMNAAWNDFGTSSLDGIYLGGWDNDINVSSSIINASSSFFEGYFQEFRYYSHPISNDIFNDFTMNPESIEGETAIGLSSSFDILNFRAPLGNLLEEKWIYSIPTSSYFTSLHPSITGSINSIVTSSFYDPTLNTTSSLYEIITYTGSIFSEPNRETYFLDQPSIGSRNRISNKIEASPDILYGNVLSINKSLQQDYQRDDKYTPDNNNLEVAFSPQEEINDDIIQTLGFNSISNTIANPDFYFESSDEYDGLKEIATYYFQKYKKGNIYDYLRLIKYFDNSIFKAIKNYVPARTSLTTGIIIKSHLLERNRVKLPLPQPTQPEYTSSINVGNFEGGTGNSLEKYNYTGSSKMFGDLDITQTWTETFDSIAGLQTRINTTQKEFYDGTFSGSNLEITDGELNPNNPVKYGNFNLDPYYIDVIKFNLQSQSMAVEFELQDRTPEFPIYFNKGYVPLTIADSLGIFYNSNGSDTSGDSQALDGLTPSTLSRKLIKLHNNLDKYSSYYFISDDSNVIRVPSDKFIINNIDAVDLADVAPIGQGPNQYNPAPTFYPPSNPNKIITNSYGDEINLTFNSFNKNTHEFIKNDSIDTTSYILLDNKVIPTKNPYTLIESSETEILSIKVSGSYDDVSYIEVNVASTSNIGNNNVLSSDGQTLNLKNSLGTTISKVVDDITLSERNLIDGTPASILLLKNQTNAKENGVWEVTDIINYNITLNRTSNSDESSELTNQIVYVSEGSVNADSYFSQSISNPIIGTDNITYTPYTPSDASFRIYVGGNFKHYFNTLDKSDTISSTLLNSIANYPGLIKLLPTGDIDTTFSTGGFNGRVRVIEIDSTGSLYVGGDFTSYQGVEANRIIKLDSDGNRDTSFNIGDGFNASVKCIALDPSGSIYVGGDFDIYSSSAILTSSLSVPGINVDFANRYPNIYSGSFYPKIIKLNLDGTIDTSFDIENDDSTRGGFDSSVNVIKLDTTGSLLVGGKFNKYKEENIKSLIKLNTSGSIDFTFENPQINGEINAIELLSDNEIYIGGEFTGYSSSISTDYYFQNLIKLDATGSLDIIFTPTEPAESLDIFATKQTSFPTSVNSIKLDGSGSLYVGGIFNIYSGSTLNATQDINLIKISSESGSLNPLFSKIYHVGHVGIIELVNSNNLFIGGYKTRQSSEYTSPNFISSINSTNTTQNLNIGKGFVGTISSDEMIFIISDTVIPTSNSSSINDSKMSFANNVVPERFNKNVLNNNLTSSNTIKILYSTSSNNTDTYYNIDGISFCVETGSNFDDYFYGSLQFQDLSPFISNLFPYAGDRVGKNETLLFSNNYKILGPYFKFDITGSNIGLDSNFNNLSYNTILSSTFKKNITMDDRRNPYNSSPFDYYSYKNTNNLRTFNLKFTNINQLKTIISDESIEALQTQKLHRPILPSSSSLTCTFTNGNTMLYYNSSINTLKQVTNYTLHPLNSGTASLFIYDSRMYGYDFVEAWRPLGFRIPFIDANGDTHRNTLVNNPDFLLDLVSSSLPATPSKINFIKTDPDVSGLEPNQIKNNSLTLYKNNTNLQKASKEYLYHEALTSTSNPNTGRINRISGSNFYMDDFINSLDTLSFSPVLTEGLDFVTSVYNPLYGNYVDGIDNPFLFKIDYEQDIIVPSNLPAILNNTAEKIKTPLSNYTTKRNTTSKYNGWRSVTTNKSVSSLYRNNFSYASNTYGDYVNKRKGTHPGTYINGDSDNIPEKDIPNIIDRIPLYFAYFKTSRFKLTNGNFLEFEIDSIIYMPNDEKILSSPRFNPRVIKIGTNKQYYEYLSGIFWNPNGKIYRRAFPLYNTQDDWNSLVSRNTFESFEGPSAGYPIITPANYLPTEINSKFIGISVDTLFEKEILSSSSDIVTSPSGSGDGFLYPTDFTEVQKRYMEKAINKLRDSNAFQ